MSEDSKDGSKEKPISPPRMSEEVSPGDFSVAGNQVLTMIFLEGYGEGGKKGTERKIDPGADREQLAGDVFHMNSIVAPLAKSKILRLLVFFALALPVALFLLKGPLVNRWKDTVKVDSRIGISTQPVIAMTRHSAIRERGYIAVPVGLVREKRLVAFEYTKPDTVVPLLAFIAPSGAIVTAVGFSEPCQSKSFHLEGEEMVCDICSTRWNLETLTGSHGECAASPLEMLGHTVQRGKIEIDEMELQAWKPKVVRG